MDFGAALRRLRLRRGVTQALAAEGVQVSRPTLTQWESGRYLPSAERARRLDDLLDAGGELYDLAERLRSPSRLRTVAAAPVVGNRTVLQLFAQVGDALVDHLRRDADGTPLGWAHNLQQHGRFETPTSTAYGIKTLLLLGGPHVDLRALERGIEDAKLTGKDGRVGWASPSQFAPRPEATAVVVDALVRVGAMSTGAAMAVLEGVVDDVTRRRTYVLTTVLETALRIAPDSALAGELLDGLLAARRSFGGCQLWPETIGEGVAKLSASPVHTARAVVVLQDAVRRTDRADLRDALRHGEDWLAENDDDDGVSEVIGREIDDDRPGGAVEELGVRHFTSAWVVRALSGVERPDAGRLRTALSLVWEWFDPESGLWAWGNGDLPVWMTHDSVAAVQAASLALAPLAVPAAGGAPSADG